MERRRTKTGKRKENKLEMACNDFIRFYPPPLALNKFRFMIKIVYKRKGTLIQLIGSFAHKRILLIGRSLNLDYSLKSS